MIKPPLVYVGHSYHRKTGSTAFLIELLSTRYDVKVVLDESWQDGGAQVTAEAINQHAPQAVVFFQLVPKPRELRRVQCGNLTWIPMHDDIRYRKPSRYRRHRGSAIKTLHFSAATEAFFSRLGYETHRVQYFPAVAPPVTRSGAPQLLFWVRRKHPSWPVLKALLGDFRPEKVTLRLAHDPGYEPPELPTEAERAEYRVEVLDRWLERDEFAQLMQSSDLFMAPRETEGIGQANLEAMANGSAVIAPDAPTMNEYLRTGETGYLYDLRRPAPLDFARWRETGDAARRVAAAGRERWLASEPGLLEFVARAAARKPSWWWRTLGKAGR